MSHKARFAVIIGITVVLLLGTLMSVTAAQKKDRFFEITPIIPIGNTAREKAGQIIARNLEKIGIGVNLRYMSWATIGPHSHRGAETGATFEEGGFDMYASCISWNSRVDPVGIANYFACDRTYPEGSGRSNYCNPEFDKLIYKAVETVDNQERWALVRQAVKLLYEDLPVIPMWRPSQFYGIRSSVKFPEHKDPYQWTTNSFKWASREIEGKTKEEMSRRERTLIFAQPSDIDALLPGFAATSYTQRAVEYMAYDSLVQLPKATYTRGPKEERGPRPALAKDWEISEDGKTWTIHLKEDVNWHDGEPFTADDVIFTYELVTDPDAGYGESEFIKRQGISWEKLDDYTVRITSEKYSPLLASNLLNIPIVPEHLLKDIPADELARSKYNTNTVVGTGPWVLEEYNPGENIKYKANEDYFGGRPWFDHVMIRFIPKGATTWYALRTGEVDMTGLWYGFTEEFKKVKDNPDLYAVQEPSFGPHMLRINTEHPILGKRKVRKAISLAIPRQVFVDVISGGLGKVANQHLPPWSPGHNPNLPSLEFDLNKAKKMLEEAGYDYDTITVKGPSEN